MRGFSDVQGSGGAELSSVFQMLEEIDGFANCQEPDLEGKPSMGWG